MAAVAPSRPVSIVKPVHGRSGNGILPASSATEKSRPNNIAASSSRAPTPRLKVIIRRLAPGLTEQEFSAFLGEEWKVGTVKVDWASYRPGKVSKDPSKPSRPSRAYLHLTSDQHLAQLSEKVRKTTFTDVKGSSSDSALLGPPTVEFAPYNRLPSNKRRRDARQGTIDQDPEFIDFLESLTNPLPKVPTVDAVNDKENKPGEAKAVTPLIQYLRDKKASKNKETSAAAKNPKHSRQESKEIKAAQAETKTTPKSSKSATTAAAAASSEKKTLPPAKIEKSIRDAVKPTSQIPATAPKTAVRSPAPKAPTQQSATQAPASPAPKPERRRERGSASAAAKILQRDLGIGPGPQGRRRRDIVPPVGATSVSSTQAGTSGESAKAQGSTTATATPSSNTTAAPPVSSSSSTSAPVPPIQAPTAPAAVRNQPKVNASSNVPAPPKQPAANTPPSKQSPAPVIAVSPGATQAFLKHANPSQGVTEPLLEEAFAPYGTIQKVEIDKKKGFAYVDFADTEALQKAIAASPVKVAQGQVVVLERKTGASLHNRNARGGGSPLSHRGGGGGSPIVRGGRGGGGRGRGGRAPPPQTKAPAGAATTSTPTAPASAEQSAVAPETNASKTAPAATAPP